MQEILILTDSIDLQPELEYVCGILSRLYRANFQVAFEFNPFTQNNTTIGYVRSDNQSQLPDNCRLSITIDAHLWRTCFQSEFESIRTEDLDGIPIVSANNKKLTFNACGRQLRTNADIFVSIFFLLTRCEERGNSVQPDQHERFRSSGSLLGGEMVNVPWVNCYAAQLAKWLNEAYGIELEARRVRPVAVISHDIDIPFQYKKLCQEASEIFYGLKGKGRYSSAKELLRYVLFLVGMRKDPYETYSYFMEVEREYGIRSTYFLLRDGANAWGLDDHRYKRIVKALVDAGHEIALHPGYDSYLDPDRIASEKASVEALSGLPVMGVRNHFLRFKVPESYRLVEKLGLSYDSTLGYAEQEGFRAGICTPFRPYDIEEHRPLDIVEIPLVVMDGTLQDYRGLTPAEADQSIRKLIDTVAQYKGTIVFNWHNTFFVESGSSWKQVFEDSMTYLAKYGFEFLTCRELADKHTMIRQ